MKELLIRTLTSFLLVFIIYFAYLNVNFFLIVLIIISFLSLLEYSKLIQKIKVNKFDRSFYLILGLIYLTSIVFFLFFKGYQIKDIVFYFIIICIATDIGGFISGKIFKGKKLTKISPNKTYAGFYGSFFMAFFFMYLFIQYLNLNIFILAVFTLSVCLLSQLGDLFFSFLKRKAKVKDTGKLLPGHGGILDRIDGIIISVPINVLIYTLSL
tara:strand:+ start:657 stop:1292 length:636 start_codon:yes stop_codon:yes gene_type:complete